MLRSPDQERVAIIRRLVGLEGDVVLSRDHRWVLVPRGHAWIESDNVAAPGLDSDAYGPVRGPQPLHVIACVPLASGPASFVFVRVQVPLGLVFARVPAVLWPPSRIGRVPPAAPQPRVRRDSGASMLPTAG